MNFNAKEHWEKIYQEKAPNQVSWFKTNPDISLELISSSGIDKSKSIIDVGGGASVLVDKLIEKNFLDLAVLDISAAAIQHAKKRLGDNAGRVKWVVSDITQFEPARQYDLWHDWAVFHFFTDPDDRKKYIKVLDKTVKANGFVIIATFSLEGPLKCSGLNVERYDAQKLSTELGNHFTLIKNIEQTHLTPWHSEQKFSYCLFKKQE
jgi:2-polyprenyl-3-methyl-5-hydroxy-6-metoxy-1,4-benzoquinol methylase